MIRTIAALAWAILAAVTPASFAQRDRFGDSLGGFGDPMAGPPGLGEPVLTLSAAFNKPVVSPGDQIALAVVMDIVHGWHIWPHQPKAVQGIRGLVQTPTEIRLTGGDGGSLPLVLGPIQWPEIHVARFDASFGAGTQIVSIEVYEGTAIAYVPIVVPADAPLGDLPVTVHLSYQACDDTQCLQPTDESVVLMLSIRSLEDAAVAAASGPAHLFEGFDATVLPRLAAGEIRADAAASRWVFNDLGLDLSLSTDGLLGLLAMVAIAAIGGFLLNLTPCVLPVIPIKIIGLSKSAGDKRRTALLGVIMALGVVAFWIAIGAAISFVSGFNAISSLFQTGWFAIVVGVIIGAMALGMFGMFTVKLPQSVYTISPRHDTVHGSFLFGAMTAVLSTPCTAPFMGSAAAWAATRPSAVTMTVFAAIGAGMALPYLLLSLNPAWVKRVPKTGPASELVKQVMGVFMVAVAIFFLGTGLAPFLSEPTSPPFQAYWWAVAAAVAAGGLWLAYRTIRITRSVPRRAVFGGAGVLLAAAGVFAAVRITDHGPIAWVYFTPAAIEQARSDGRVIVTDFTAEWCINCKALEATVLFSREVASVLNGPGVVPLKVDLTGDNPDGQALLRHYGQVAIPVLAIEGPGTASTGPIVFNAYTPAQVLEAVERARGSRASR